MYCSRSQCSIISLSCVCRVKIIKNDSDRTAHVGYILYLDGCLRVFINFNELYCATSSATLKPVRWIRYTHITMDRTRLDKVHHPVRNVLSTALPQPLSWLKSIESRVGGFREIISKRFVFSTVLPVYFKVRWWQRYSINCTFSKTPRWEVQHTCSVHKQIHIIE